MIMIGIGIWIGIKRCRVADPAGEPEAHDAGDLPGPVGDPAVQGPVGAFIAPGHDGVLYGAVPPEELGAVADPAGEPEAHDAGDLPGPVGDPAVQGPAGAFMAPGHDGVRYRAVPLDELGAVADPAGEPEAHDAGDLPGPVGDPAVQGPAGAFMAPGHDGVRYRAVPLDELGAVADPEGEPEAQDAGDLPGPVGDPADQGPAGAFMAPGHDHVPPDELGAVADPEGEPEAHDAGDLPGPVGDPADQGPAGAFMAPGHDHVPPDELGAGGEVSILNILSPV
ncbi:collagen alpha-1(I) chain-like [Conger conger]|uniref:collagen alpha-1(I) chain-like n=1 Tax=Conger conger TaxID=82655 RepID=UPI002A59B4E4|nr:collagen alpha-1(I) chain-like [Conger conger]